MGRPGPKAVRLAKAETPAVPFTDFDPAQPEEWYRDRVPLVHRKRFGQFFTPEPVAAVMCRWIAEQKPATVLDPAVGPGVFLRHLLQELPTCRATAIDIDPLALQAAKKSLPAKRVTCRCHDFLTWESAATFDAVIANPPYLRHHDMDYGQDIFQAVGQRNGVKLSRLTNAYALFILECCRRLRPGGRAAVIVPGEWTNANFGMAIKDYLLSRNLLRWLVYVSHAERVFGDALTTACLLFIEKAKAAQPSLVATVYLEEPSALPLLPRLWSSPREPTVGLFVRSIATEVLRTAAKWDHLLRQSLEAPAPGFVPLRELADTRRGIATGANDFFHMKPSAAQAHGLAPNHLHPCVGRAADVSGLVFTATDWQRLMQEDRRGYLLKLDGKLTAPERRYLAKGEADGLPERFLLAQRSLWYAMEERRPAPIWAAVFGRKELRFVWNRARSLNLTTFHCIYPRITTGPFVPALVACLNSTVVQEKAKGQRRVYAGGLSKFEPRDLLEIQVPDLRLVSGETLALLAAQLRLLDNAYKGGDSHARSAAERDLDQAVRDAAALAASNAGSS
jgi:adenine-specific DNA-methyltransferase